MHGNNVWMGKTSGNLGFTTTYVRFLWWIIKGFERETLYEGFERVGYLCTSDDFPAKNNYNFSLRIQNPELAGVYDLDILSD